VGQDFALSERIVFGQEAHAWKELRESLLGKEKNVD
jgi:hypothetical protein